MKRSILTAAFVVALTIPAHAAAEIEPDQVPEPKYVKRCGKTTAGETVSYVWFEMQGQLGVPGFYPPSFRFTGGPYLAMWTRRSLEGTPEVTIARWSRTALSGAYGCPQKREAMASLVHEFAHVYQQTWVREGELRPDNVDEAVPEGLAEAFAQNVMRDVFGFTRKQFDPTWDVYNAYAREIRRRFPPAFINRGQFGTNWGLDPRMISY
jgi:hypothetical protein